MKEMLEKIVKALVDEPEKVKINEVKGDQITIFQINCAEMDFGKVIGKQGRTVEAMRVIAQAAAFKERMRAVKIEVNELDKRR